MTGKLEAVSCKDSISIVDATAVKVKSNCTARILALCCFSLLMSPIGYAALSLRLDYKHCNLPVSEWQNAYRIHSSCQ